MSGRNIMTIEGYVVVKQVRKNGFKKTILKKAVRYRCINRELIGTAMGGLSNGPIPSNLCCCKLPLYVYIYRTDRILKRVAPPSKYNMNRCLGSCVAMNST